MKKIMSLMLGLSLILGAATVSAFAQEKTETTKKAKKSKKSKKTDTTSTEKKS